MPPPGTAYIMSTFTGGHCSKFVAHVIILSNWDVTLIVFRFEHPTMGGWWTGVPFTNRDYPNQDLFQDKLHPHKLWDVINHPSPHDDVIKWKHFPRYWPFVRGIHRSPVNSPHKGQWRGALMLPLICAGINGWVNNREAGDLRRHRTHYDVIVMLTSTGI